jgi:cytochrome c553/mono/diheme cytochrome c family protein
MHMTKMPKRALTVALLVLGGWGCSSSSTTPKDASGDGPKDAAAGKGGGGGTGTAGSTAGAGGGGGTGTAGTDAGAAGSDASTGDASDAPVVVLTTQQLRGQYIVDHVAACGDCHTPQGAMGPDLTKYLAGNASFAVLQNGHKLGTRNLTNDETGLKNRTDAEIKAMFMDGKRPVAAGTEGLNPIMPYYVFHNMTSADGDAVVAYLRTVKAVANSIPKRDIEFDVPGPANYLDLAKIPMPAAGADGGTDGGDAGGDAGGGADFASAMRGRYLAAQAGVCIECHTPHQMAADVLDPAKFFSGGEDFSVFFATTLMIHPVSKNLTSDNATGLGTWAASDIVKAIKMGKAKDGTGICPPMPAGPMGAFGGLTDGDALDIANYIKSLPPIVHNVPDMCVFPPVPPDGGADGATDGLASEAGVDAGVDAATGN